METRILSGGTCLFRKTSSKKRNLQKEGCTQLLSSGKKGNREGRLLLLKGDALTSENRKAKARTALQKPSYLGRESTNFFGGPRAAVI